MRRSIDRNNVTLKCEQPFLLMPVVDDDEFPALQRIHGSVEPRVRQLPCDALKADGSIACELEETGITADYISGYSF